MTWYANAQSVPCLPERDGGPAAHVAQAIGRRASQRLPRAHDRFPDCLSGDHSGPYGPTLCRVYAPGMVIRSELAGLSNAEARRVLGGLPRAGDYDIVVKPLRYRTRPHLAARCEFEDRRIVLQVPVPFRPFKEPVVFAARRKRGHGIRFAWASETVSFRLRREVLRFLYCHEWMHWYLFEALGKRSAAETACDRFALRNFRRLRVSTADADQALRRRRAPR